MAESGLGVMLKRLFARPDKIKELSPPPEDAPRPEPPRSGPPLVLLVPSVAGLSIYQTRLFHDAHSAAAFIESCNPYRIYKEGIIAYWAMHTSPPAGFDSECAVLVRVEPASDLVHPYAFTDLQAATAYLRLRMAESGEPPESFLVHWAASIRISANPSGEVSLDPSEPPAAAAAHPSFVREPLPAPAPADELPEVSERTEGPAETTGRRTRRLVSATHWARKKANRRLTPRVKAHALALGLLGFTPREIESELHAMLPGERVPAYATIARWLRRAGISRAALKRWEMMSDQAMRILEKRLAELDDVPLAEAARVAALLEQMRRR